MPLVFLFLRAVEGLIVMTRCGVSARGDARIAVAMFLAAMLCGPVFVRADFDYVLDDGSGSFNIGPSAFDAQMLWGNYFDAQPGAMLIDRVSVAFATNVPQGRAVRLVVFDDPTDDADPTDAIPVSILDSVTSPFGFNEFLEFDVPDAAVTGGFFVAAMMNLNQGEPAARMDPQSPLGRSWIFFDDFDSVALDDLGSSPLFFNMSTSPFNGSWMIRAHGVAVPEPGAAGLVLMGAGLLVRRWRLRG
jgi:hypothetical protein